MSLLERSILSIIEPDFSVLNLEKISMIDTSNSEESRKGLSNEQDPESKYINDPTMQVGVMTPWVSINSMVIQRENLNSFELNLNDRIPTIFVSFKDKKNAMAIDGPLDSGIISIYIKPPDHENQRPIRLDFNITGFDGNPKSRVYACSGILRLPKFFGELCQAFKPNTSFEHLKKICQDLGIGYASNESATADSMARLIPFENYEFFIDDTVKTSYKDDDSFFDWYIDPWYNLCFVNVNKQFELEDKFEKINISAWPPISAAPLGESGAGSAEIATFMLSNIHPYLISNLGIEGFTIKNNAGDVAIKNGYQRNGYWLNIDGKTIKPENAYSEALTTPGAEQDFILLKGRKRDDNTAHDYRNWNKASWLGKQSLNTNQGNVHENYAFAKILNHQNLEELRKTNLDLNMRGINFYIYKYQKIPVAIYESGAEEIKAALTYRNDLLGDFTKEVNPEDKNDDIYNQEGMIDSHGATLQVINTFLSGYYVVGGIKYVWNKTPGYMKQELVLIRREWPIPTKNNMP
jgi:hypothetical protein